MNRHTVTKNPFGGRRIISKHVSSRARESTLDQQQTTKTARGEGLEWHKFITQGLQDDQGTTKDIKHQKNVSN